MLIEIYSDNLNKKDISKNLHRSARAIIVVDNQVLLLHTKTLDYFMLPGGGIKENETPELSVIREIKEETGYFGEIIKKTVIIKEFFPEATWETHYFLVKIDKNKFTSVKFTEEEKMQDLHQKWFKVDEALILLDNHESNFKNAYNIMQREFIALINSKEKG
ncbi:MAG: NUDIX domain-containing protein [Candidatus Izemoplasmatales bacterium]|nr:NUDIX domain-containing protein [Candidatus Izemoplasmatales bacterium]